jgi:tyrosyl-tRNA synthetase
MSPSTVDEQVELLLRGTVFADEVGDLEPQGLRQKMAEELRDRLREGRPLRVYQGFDPTARSLHLGHMVPAIKLRQFQQLGHQVIFLVGDYTAMIGDPSGQSSERSRLTHEQATENAKLYVDQAFHLLTPEQTEVRRNGEWLSRLTFADLIELAALFPLKQIVARRDFQARMEAGDSLRFHECLYALMQGYDAFALECDVQVGGYDQHFNMLAGRIIQQSRGQKPHVMLTMPLLMGTDRRKMSKSYGNAIMLTDTPADMYGKCLRVSDDLIPQYLDLVTTLEPDEIEAAKAALAAGEAHPKELKKRIGSNVTRQYHGEAAAREAAETFRLVSEERSAPADVPAAEVSVGPEGLWLPRVLAELGLVKSSSEARRLLAQGAIKLDGERVTDPEARLLPGPEVLVQVGKRKFLRILAR